MRYMILLSLFLYGCKSLERQRTQANLFFDKHPIELARKCDKEFPVLDSVAVEYHTTPAWIPGFYAEQWIDSVQTAYNALLVKINIAKEQADSISNACADVVIGYMKDMDQLQRQINKLSTSKALRRDTVTTLRTIYRRSTAVEAILSDSINQYRYQLGEMTDLSNKQVRDLDKKEELIKELKADKKDWMWKAIGTWIGMAIIMGGLLFMKLKSKI